MGREKTGRKTHTQGVEDSSKGNVTYQKASKQKREVGRRTISARARSLADKRRQKLKKEIQGEKHLGERTILQKESNIAMSA